ncbi:MAG: hypothetical protein ACJ74U_09775 [Jatrophihabitantaceae bacterium]
MAGPSNPDEATNTEPVPQAARPAGSRTESAWTAVSGSGDAEYGEPAAERDGSDRAFATSADTPLESDVNQQGPAGVRQGSGDVAAGYGEVDDGLGVPDAVPAEDLAEGPPDGR